ncbi:uncharacterized protein LY89DRAFT_742509 [Mollisia scopiformis]|uniref:Uncharacterized protein n=1 Tax=Mollisia scopiformis TaxID=149040 RepID=A0A132B7S9_MOLSC|nr:uncharacterized protein LY89DRAFT_742509 [Mollisia scopiformis]KUJ07737.1 hypothetical protein LY89DRAFT_742509 [Mollisia scopiformis]
MRIVNGLALWLLMASTCCVAAWDFGLNERTKSECQLVDFDTLQAIKRDGHNFHIGPKGFYINTKNGCFITEVDSSEFKTKQPKAYESWDYLMKLANGEQMEEKEDYTIIPAEREIDRSTTLNIALILWFILSRVFPGWI